MSSAEELKNIGNEEFKKGNFQAAWDHYDKAASLDSSNPVYLANRAQCELKLEQYGSALQSCTDALEIDPQQVKCYYRRAIALSGMMHYSKAVKDFQKVVQMAPSFAEGRTRLQAAQGMARYIAFQAAIKTDDEPSIFETIDFDSMPDTDGPNTELPLDLDNLSQDQINGVVAHFKDGKQLSRKTVYKIIMAVSSLLENEPTMNEVYPPENGKITVCGDTHGQFYDLVHIFDENGWPSEKHSYLFNGDFVDRGSWSTEVILLLYLLKILYPHNLLLNRGNHETDAMNATYGFTGECKAKYKTEKVFKAFSESFSKLPLACLIGDAYLVVHGGLFSKEGVTLDDIRKLDRFAQKQPSQEGLMMEMLWSDPQANKGLAPSRRGIAHMFGPDITARFVEQNKLKAVIRSHEVRDNGYEEEHNGKLVTVFSAPNYCDSTGNMGAYINIGGDLALNYVQFEAVEHPSIPPMAYASGLMR